MRLETERLILRDFVEEDWQRAFEYESDPRYLRYYEWTERTPESVKEFIGWFLAHQTQTPRFKFQLAIVPKSDNLLIGSCGVRMDQVGAVDRVGPGEWVRRGEPQRREYVGQALVSGPCRDRSRPQARAGRAAEDRRPRPRPRTAGAPD